MQFVIIKKLTLAIFKMAELFIYIFLIHFILFILVSNNCVLLLTLQEPGYGGHLNRVAMRALAYAEHT